MPETKKALIDLEKKGVSLILASGRSYTRLLPYAKELEMDKYHGYLLEVDGIAIYDVHEDKRSVLKRMEPQEIEEIFTYLMGLDCESMACFDDGLFDYFNEDIYQLKVQLRKEMNLLMIILGLQGLGLGLRTCVMAILKSHILKHLMKSTDLLIRFN